MTKQLTRQEIEAVVERLADGTDIHLCEPDCMDMECRNCITEFEPVYIGTVLEKMQEKLKYLVSTATFTGCRENPHGTYEYFVSEVFAKFLHLYAECGVAKSLQEIVEASGWKEVRILPEGWDDEQGGCSCHINPPCSFCEYSTYEEVLKSPEANALFSFLQEIEL